MYKIKFQDVKNKIITNIRIKLFIGFTKFIKFTRFTRFYEKNII